MFIVGLGEFRDIPGYEHHYMIAKSGLIFSVKTLRLLSRSLTYDKITLTLYRIKREHVVKDLVKLAFSTQ